MAPVPRRGSLVGALCSRLAHLARRTRTQTALPSTAAAWRLKGSPAELCAPETRGSDRLAGGSAAAYARERGRGTGGGTVTATLHMFCRTRSMPVASSIATLSSPARFSAGSMRARSGHSPASRPPAAQISAAPMLLCAGARSSQP